MSDENPKGGEIGLRNHGIQVAFIGVREIHFESDRLPSAFKVSDLEDQVFGIGHSQYNTERKRITVMVKWSVKSKDGGVQMRIELNSEFTVDESAFPAARVEEWASKGAFYVLIPYLREHVQALCLRTGFPLLILPLLEIPTFKVSQEKQESPPAELTAVN